MGMSASQARLLSLTARLSDLELSAQMVSGAKLALATKSNDVSRKYLDAMDNKQLKVLNPENSRYIDATASNLKTYGAISADYRQRFLKSPNKAVLVSESIAAAYKASNGSPEGFLNSFGYTQYPDGASALAGDAGVQRQTAMDYSNYVLGQVANYEAVYATYSNAQVANNYAKADLNKSKNLNNEIEGLSTEYYKLNPKTGTYTAQIQETFKVLDYIKATAEKERNLIKASATRSTDAATIIKNNGGTAAEITSADTNAIWANASYTGRTDVIGSAEVIYNNVLNAIWTAKQILLGQMPGSANVQAEVALQYCRDLATTAQASTAGTAASTDKAFYLLGTKTLPPAKATLDTAVNQAKPALQQTLANLDFYYTSNELTAVQNQLKSTDPKAMWAQNIKANMQTLQATLDVNVLAATYDVPYKYDASFNQYHLNLFNEIQECGIVTQPDENMNNAEWLYEQLQAGTLTLAEQDSESKDFVNISWKTDDERLVTEDDDRALAKAKAEYDMEMAEIQEKDTRFDEKLKYIDTEHGAIQTEIDSVKKIIDKNVERTFKIFDA